MECIHPNCTVEAKPQLYKRNVCGYHKNWSTASETGVKKSITKNGTSNVAKWENKLDELGSKLEDARYAVDTAAESLEDYKASQTDLFTSQNETHTKLKAVHKPLDEAHRRLKDRMRTTVRNAYIMEGISSRYADFYTDDTVKRYFGDSWVPPKPEVKDDHADPSKLANFKLKVKKSGKDKVATEAARDTFGDLLKADIEEYTKAYEAYEAVYNEYKEVMEDYSQYSQEVSMLTKELNASQTALDEAEEAMDTTQAKMLAGIPFEHTETNVGPGKDLTERIRQLPNGKFNIWLKSTDHKGRVEYLQADRIQVSPLGMTGRPTPHLRSGDRSLTASTHYGGSRRGAVSHRNPEVIIDENATGKRVDALAWHYTIDSGD